MSTQAILRIYGMIVDDAVWEDIVAAVWVHIRLLQEAAAKHQRQISEREAYDAVWLALTLGVELPQMMLSDDDKDKLHGFFLSTGTDGLWDDRPKEPEKPRTPVIIGKRKVRIR